MATITNNLHMTAPEASDFYSVLVTRGNLAILDEEVPKEMVGATSSVDGESGRVPAPQVADKDKFLKGDGTWATPSGGVDVTGTLTAGSTSLTLSDASILITSTLDFYTDVFGVNPTSVIVANGSVTMTFDSQSVDVGVKVRVS